ncbi:MAG TPA: M20/M25/M40 family metallo-hydrolase [Thermoanaerobaculia bacterium]|nr:M20/M25/M40 family metallo-hydrolase [Thermoanaerobaculia bacterium]HQP85396.1 M20/M25/M40 family metallo-hydrolase [Thermoanaerobaculia bacterium]
MRKTVLVPALTIAAAFGGVLAAPPAVAQPSPASAAPATSAADAARPRFVLPKAGEAIPAPLRAALDGVRAAALRAHVDFLAAPALGGRGLGSDGLEAALEYGAAQLALAGVAPYGATDAQGARTYFQPVPMREIREPGGSVEIERRAGETTARRTFVHGVDVVVPPQPARSVSGPLVFAGYGIRESAPARDDYRGLDVKGRVVVLREGLPPGEAWARKDLVEKYAAGDTEERWAAKLETAKALGAVAVLAVEGNDWATRLLGTEKPATFAFRSMAEGPSLEPLVFRCAPAVLEALLGAAPKAEEPSRALPASATLRATAVEKTGLSRNVVGILPGSDPALKGEAVVLGAHADHLGRVDGVTHPGADDNASGVAALLEIARAFASSPVQPKRTLVFALWTGEEEDKIGSGHWVRDPLWPLARTAVYLNFDMVAHPWKAEEIRDLVTAAKLPGAAAFLAAARPDSFIEPGVASFAPDLGPLLARAGSAAELALHLDWTEGVNGGSDYRDFARARVPFVRFFGNFHPDYHRPGDTPASIDPAQVRRVTRLGLATAWLAADR